VSRRLIAVSLSAAAASAIVAPVAARADVVVPHVATHSVTPHATAPAPPPSPAPSPEPPAAAGTQSQWEPPGWAPAPDTGPAPSEHSQSGAPAVLPTDSPLGPWDPDCQAGCLKRWELYYTDELDRLNAEGESKVLIDLVKATLGAVEQEISAGQQLEDDRAAWAAADEQDRAANADWEEPDAISGGSLSGSSEPLTYTEVTDELVDPILCVLGTYVSINNWLEDPVGGSNACF